MRGSAIAAAFLFLWFNFVSLPLAAVTPGLEMSWNGAIIHFAAQGLQFGRDIIFTYGPLGHLISFVYTGELFDVRIAWELISKTAFAAVLCVAMLRLPVIWRLPFVLYAGWFIWADPIADALYALAIAATSALLIRQKQPSLIWLSSAGVFLGVASLIKFTYFVLAVLAIAALGIALISKGNWRRFAGMVAVTGFSFLICWKLAGQQFSTLPAYFSASLQITAGYKEAMSAPAEFAAVTLAGTAAASIAIALCAVLIAAERSWSAGALLFFLAGSLFLAWSRGFVRADDHVLSFFALCPVLMLLVWVGFAGGAAARWAVHILSALLFAVCLAGIMAQKPVVLSGIAHDTASRFREAWRVLTDAAAIRSRLEQELASNRVEYALPRVKAEVGGKSIDVLGYEQGIALLNDLNYTPRFVFQGYSAYTPSLISANTARYTGSQAPEYVLFKNQPVDRRFPTLEDARVVRQLLYNFQPLFEERGYLLWKRVRPPSIPPLRELAAGKSSINRPLALPAESPLWLELRIRKTLWGSLVSFFHKLPPIYAEVVASDGRRHDFRIVPALAAEGFLVSPLLQTQRDFIKTAFGSDMPAVAQLRVRISRPLRGFYQPTIEWRIFSLPPIPVRSGGSMEDVIEPAIVHPELQRLFDASDSILVRFDTPERLDQITSVNDVLTAPTAEGLLLKATGTDPQIALPPFFVEDDQQLLIKIVIESPADTGLQMFPLADREKRYGVQVIDAHLREGSNTLFFSLPAAAVAGGAIRIDPGMQPGEYMLKSIEIRGTPRAETPAQ